MRNMRIKLWSNWCEISKFRISYRNFRRWISSALKYGRKPFLASLQTKSSISSCYIFNLIWRRVRNLKMGEIISGKFYVFGVTEKEEREQIWSPWQISEDS